MLGQPSKEELARKKSILTIQCAYRCYLSRLEAQDRFRAQYRKIFDEDVDNYMYQNKKDLTTVPHLPIFFYNSGGFPTPPELHASVNYNPGNEATGKGYAILITNVQYTLGEWSPVPPELEFDHDQIYNMLTHEYIGRMRPENVISLKNPTCNEVIDCLKQARRLCKTNGFVFLYLATHIVTVINKEKKEFKDETAYLAFRDTSWGKAMEIIESSIALKDFCRLVNNIKSKKKTICINYALAPHVPSITYSAKSIYPPPNFHQRLADMCNCPVIGSCAIGENITDYMKYHSPIEWEEEDNKRKEELAKLQKPVEVHFSITKQETVASKKVVPYNPYETILWEKLLKEYDIPPIKEITKTPKPTKARPTWKQDADTGHEIEIELPKEQEIRSHSYRVAYWKVKRTVAKPVNFVKELYIRHQKTTMTSPKQHSLVDSGRTIFAKAITMAIRGGASKPTEGHVNLKNFYLFIFQTMKDMVNKMNEKFQPEPDESKDASEEEKKDEQQPKKKKFQQSPVLILPQGSNEYLTYPICYRIGPPAAPERPFIVQVKDHEVTLEWYNPPFDGIAPTKYRIYMKNVTRIFNKWLDVYYPGDITKTKFSVRNLPMGISCQFKVAAFNNGGWGDTSDETMMVTPGEDNLATPDHIRWQRIQQSGILGVLDAMERSPKNLSEQLRGLKMLSGFMLEFNGFKGSKTALRSSRHMMKLLKDFTRNPDLIALCFTILGWSLRGKTERKVKALVSQEKLEEIVAQRLETFRHDTGVVTSIEWMRNGIFSKYVPAVGENSHHVLFPTLEGKEEAEEDSEEEETEEG